MQSFKACSLIGLPSLVADTCHVYQVELSDACSLGDFKNYLSEHEKARASRLQADKRDNFIKTRGLLRHLLGHYLHENPQDIRFNYNANGKPSVVGHAIFFSLSHVDNKLLMAFTTHGSLGIDCENALIKRDYIKIAKRKFNAIEYSRFESEQATSEAFYKIWTEKEAFIKMRGSSVFQKTEKVANSVRCFEPWQGYQAALVFEGEALYFTLLGR